MVLADILSKRLMNLKQKTSIQDYVFEFETFVNKIKDEIFVVDKKYFFMNGPHFRTRKKVVIFNRRALDKAIRESMRLDNQETEKERRPRDKFKLEVKIISEIINALKCKPYA